MSVGNVNMGIGGSLNIHDFSSLMLSLALLMNLQNELQSLLDSSLPNLNNNVSLSVSGTTVQSVMNNYPAWMNQIAGVLADLQSLYNYLSPIAHAVNTSH
ncbi:hypothetical protein ccbrp13_44820 [Ktedonobacteria bacterium brp13]|jgi:hypothetical protein|nr:hypothetical protein ccbrp13_44820 [Ktedonobacteria bacterium brp13]